MAITVRHDMDPGVVGETIQRSVRQRQAAAQASQASQLASLRASTGPRRRFSGTSQPGFAQFVDPPPVADVPEPGPAPSQGALALEAFRVGSLTDGFNQFMQEFEAYEIPQDRVQKFASTWRAVVEDAGLTPEQRLVGLEQVLSHGQSMIDGSPKRRDKRQEWWESLKTNPDPVVMDPESGQPVENPFYKAQRDEFREQQQQAEAERKAEALRLQQAKEARIASATSTVERAREARTELTQARTEALAAQKAREEDLAAQKVPEPVRVVIAGAGRTIAAAESVLDANIRVSQTRAGAAQRMAEAAERDLERRTTVVAQRQEMRAQLERDMASATNDRNRQAFAAQMVEVEQALAQAEEAAAAAVRQAEDARRASDSASGDIDATLLRHAELVRARAELSMTLDPEQVQRILTGVQALVAQQ